MKVTVHDTPVIPDYGYLLPPLSGGLVISKRRQLLLIANAGPEMIIKSRKLWIEITDLQDL